MGDRIAHVVLPDRPEGWYQGWQRISRDACARMVQPQHSWAGSRPQRQQAGSWNLRVSGGSANVLFCKAPAIGVCKFDVLAVLDLCETKDGRVVKYISAECRPQSTRRGGAHGARVPPDCWCCCRVHMPAACGVFAFAFEPAHCWALDTQLRPPPCRVGFLATSTINATTRDTADQQGFACKPPEPVVQLLSQYSSAFGHAQQRTCPGMCRGDCLSV